MVRELYHHVHYPLMGPLGLAPTMVQETRITVPREDADWIARSLADAGLTVMDTGDRVTTDAGVNAEAVLCVASFEQADQTQASMQGSYLRP